MPNFRLKCQKVHLTYKTHLDLGDFKARILNKVGNDNVKMFSFVHEVGDENEDNPTPYEHTHVFLWTKKPMETQDARYFDVKTKDEDGHDVDIHPNIQNKRGIDWAKTIVLKYHLGHKTKKDGKKYFIAPIMVHQEGVEEWKMDSDAYQIAIDAPTMVDAALDLGIQIKSLSDVNLVRKESKKRKLNPPKWKLEDFAHTRLDLSKPLLVWGNAGTGKTQFVKAHFTNPHIVRHNEGMKHFDPTFHDGIIFDDMAFNDCTLYHVQHLLDMDEASQIRCLHGSYEIPAGTARVFTSNCDTLFQPKNWHELNDQQVYSIARRYNVVKIDRDIRKSCGP